MTASGPHDVATASAATRQRPISLALIVGGYWVLAALWIVVSDLLLFRSKGHSFGDNAASIGKGLLFVTVTAVLLAIALGRRERQLDEAQRVEADLRQQVESAHRLESLGRMAGAVAHDYNNLLTVMRGHLDLVRAKALPGQQAHLDTLHEVVERAVKSTSELQVVAKQHDLHPERDDLGAVLDDFEEMMRGSVPEGCELRVERTASPLHVVIDRRRFDQVLLNLVHNAFDAMPGGGMVSLSASSREDRALLVVADTGQGMPDELQRHCFEPYFTTKPDGRGTGLGLSISHGIVQQHGGELEVSSEPGRGTTFTISLPLAH